MNTFSPKPGSNDALEQGCTCPILGNMHGKGVKDKEGNIGYIVDIHCPLHGNEGSINYLKDIIFK